MRTTLLGETGAGPASAASSTAVPGAATRPLPALLLRAVPPLLLASAARLTLRMVVRWCGAALEAHRVDRREERQAVAASGQVAAAPPVPLRSSGAGADRQFGG